MALKSCKNSPDREQEILEAARAHVAMTEHADSLTAAFEHGHWWVMCSECGGQWDAVDASGGQSVDGFDFEEVTLPRRVHQ